MRFEVNGHDISDKVKSVIEVYVNSFNLNMRLIEYKPFEEEHIRELRKEILKHCSLFSTKLILEDGYYEKYHYDNVWYWVPEIFGEERD